MEAGDQEKLCQFPTTQWSSIFRAADDRGGQPSEAIQKFLLSYLPAMRAHLFRAYRFDADSANDILQDFIAEKILERNILKVADPERGRFRTFLVAVLNNFVRNNLSRRGIVRHYCVTTLSAEQLDLLPSSPCADSFDVAWARNVIALTIERMRADCERDGRIHIWRVFEHRILVPVLEQRTPVAYDCLARDLGFKTVLQAANALTTAKRVFARTLRTVVGEYSRNDLELEEEIHDLKTILASDH